MIWTDGFSEAIRRSAGLTCIDLGANSGKITRKMASGTKQVIAFEPDPWTHAILKANVTDLTNVRIENAAAGIAEEVVLLYRHKQFDEDPIRFSESSSIIASKSNVTEMGAVEVRQVDFVKYLEDLDQEIGVLKVDIEGAELALLEALFARPDILGRIEYIFMETHERQIPDHATRVRALRKKAHRMDRPYINLYWHLEL